MRGNNYNLTKHVTKMIRISAIKRAIGSLLNIPNSLFIEGETYQEYIQGTIRRANWICFIYTFVVNPV